MKQAGISISSTYSQVRIAASWLRNEISPYLSLEKMSDLELAVVEALNNVVHHAYRDVPGGTITITFVVTAGGVEICIRDTGAVWTESPLGDRSGGKDELPESGRGLGIIRACVDSVEVSRTSRTNEMKLKLGRFG